MQVWVQRKQLVASGRRPNRVVISRADYRTIQDYHRGLGVLPEGVEDYISQYSLFGLPFFLDEGGDCRVGCEEDDPSGSSD